MEETKYVKLENSKYGKFCLITIVSALPWLVGFHFSFVNPITPSLRTVYNETYKARNNASLPETIWTTLLTFSASSTIIGGFIGGVTTKLLLNYVTSNRALQITHVVNILAIAIMALGTGLTGSYEVFIIGRLIVGYPLGMCYVIVPTMIAETSERSNQGLWQAIFGTVVSLGLFSGSVLGHPNVMGSTTLWPFLLGIAAIPSVLCLLAITRLPEPVIHLLKTGQKSQALKALLKMRKGNEDDIIRELHDIESEINSTESTVDIRTILSVRQYRNQFIGVNMLFANLMLVGVNNIVLYSTVVFTDAGLNGENAAYATIGIFGLQFLSACVGSKLVHKFGGSHVCIGANIILIFALVLFILAKVFTYLSPDILPYIAILAVAIFMVAWAGGTNQATFAVIGAITIAPTRVSCISYANVILWLSSFLVGFLPPYLQQGLGNYAMAPWVVFAVAFLIYMIVYLPNTKKNTPEEIQAKLGAISSIGSTRSTQAFAEL